MYPPIHWVPRYPIHQCLPVRVFSENHLESWGAAVFTVWARAEIFFGNEKRGGKFYHFPLFRRRFLPFLCLCSFSHANEPRNISQKVHLPGRDPRSLRDREKIQFHFSQSLHFRIAMNMENESLGVYLQTCFSPHDSPIHRLARTEHILDHGSSHSNRAGHFRGCDEEYNS